MEKLKEELEKRKTVKRREIANQIQVAKEQGDLSENLEYQEAKEQQGTNEVAILNLEQQIAHAVVIERKTGASKLSLGTKFVVLTPGGSEKNSNSLVRVKQILLMEKLVTNLRLVKHFLEKKKEKMSRLIYHQENPFIKLFLFHKYDP